MIVLVYAGIDEAGYGPMLGPLCIAASTFVIDEHDPQAGAPNLWRRLSGAVCRSRRDRRRRIAIDDSKRLKDAGSVRRHPLRHLERGVLAFCGTSGSRPTSDEELFDRILAERPRAPWYDSTTALPAAMDAGQLAIDISRLSRAMEQAGIRCTSLSCEVIDAGPFNRQVDRLGTKAAVNLGAVLRHVDAVWRSFPGEHPRVIVDRQGGRIHYREDLQPAYPEARIRILAESETLSRYRLRRGDRELTVSFRREAESAHLPVALASMVAKYLRELYMLRLNRYFQGHLPQLKPTAGYVQDARRYLRDIEPVVRRLHLERPALVRQV